MYVIIGIHFNPLLHKYSFRRINKQKAFENIVGKEEIARNEQFLHFPQCFLLNHIILAHLSIILLLNWKSTKLACEVNGKYFSTVELTLMLLIILYFFYSRSPPSSSSFC